MLHSIRFQKAWRCRKCHARFYSSGVPAAEPKPHFTREKSLHHRHHRSHPFRINVPYRRRVEAAVFLLLLAIFYLFLRDLSAERAPASEGRLGTDVTLVA